MFERVSGEGLFVFWDLGISSLTCCRCALLSSARPNMLSVIYVEIQRREICGCVKGSSGIPTASRGVSSCSTFYTYQWWCPSQGGGGLSTRIRYLNIVLKDVGGLERRKISEIFDRSLALMWLDWCLWWLTLHSLLGIARLQRWICCARGISIGGPLLVMENLTFLEWVTYWPGS